MKSEPDPSTPTVGFSTGPLVALDLSSQASYTDFPVRGSGTKLVTSYKSLFKEGVAPGVKKGPETAESQLI